jgi:hypothetical protein
MRTTPLKVSQSLLCVLALVNVAVFCAWSPMTVSVIGTALLLYRIAVRETRSKWLGWMTLGLFAAACQGAELRTTFLLLAGAYLIGYSESRVRDALGMLCLAAGSAVDPHAILFLFGGIAYLAWRDTRSGGHAWRTWPAAVIGLVFAAAAGAADLAFEPITREGFIAFVESISRRFLVPAALAGAGLQLSLERGRPMSVWTFLLPVGFLSGLWSPSTMMLTFGIWLILGAILTLPRLTRQIAWLDSVHFPAMALTIALAAFAYGWEPSTFGAPAASLKILATDTHKPSGRHAPRNDGCDDHHRDHGGRGVPVGFVIP